jgi:hypothetical protein
MKLLFYYYDETADRKDFLNCYGVRNVENTNIDDYNCGGFALRTFSWYKPYTFEREDIVDIIVDLECQGYNYDYVTNKLLDIFEQQMLEDFSDLERVDYGYEPAEDEDFIAFRVFYDIEIDNSCDEPEVDFFDYDFHYRVFRDGEWLEKNGGGEIREAYGDWQTYDGYCYDSEVRYYIKKIG